MTEQDKRNSHSDDIKHNLDMGVFTEKNMRICQVLCR